MATKNTIYKPIPDPFLEDLPKKNTTTLRYQALSLIEDTIDLTGGPSRDRLGGVGPPVVRRIKGVSVWAGPGGSIFPCIYIYICAYIYI